VLGGRSGFLFLLITLQECLLSLNALVLFSSFSFFCLSKRKERNLPAGRQGKGPPKTNAPHVLGIALRCGYAEYALSVVSAGAHDGAVGQW